MRGLCLLLALCASPLAAKPVEVDLELVLAVDISQSMHFPELMLQRRGYAAALMSDEVLTAIRSGALGRIGLAYVEWSDVDQQRVLVNWTVIDGRDAAAAFGATIVAETGGTQRETSISAGLMFASAMFDASPFTSWRHVIDISGDGPNNNGAPVEPARDAVLARGITINGLPVMIGSDPVWRLSDLDLYYHDCVIGGPGAFVLPVEGLERFAEAVQRKLVLEIAGGEPGPWPARLIPAAGYDCLVGEKIREDRKKNRPKN